MKKIVKRTVNIRTYTPFRNRLRKRLPTLTRRITSRLSDLSSNVHSGNVPYTTDNLRVSDDAHGAPAIPKSSVIYFTNEAAL